MENHIKGSFKLQIIFGGILPLSIGGIIYTLFRDTKIYLFDFFRYFNLLNEVNEIKGKVFNIKILLPEWFIYSLPDGLWLFAYVSILMAIWKNSLSFKNLVFILNIPIIGILSELLQKSKLINGTFDPIDLLLYIIGTLIPLFIFKQTKINLS